MKKETPNLIQDQLKIGDKVKMINCGEADLYPNKVWICRTDSYAYPYGKKEQVVMLEGKAGCFLCSCLTLANNQ